MMDQGVFYRICRVDGMPQNCEVAARSPPLAASRTDAQPPGVRRFHRPKGASRTSQRAEVRHPAVASGVALILQQGAAHLLPRLVGVRMVADYPLGGFVVPTRRAERSVSAVQNTVQLSVQPHAGSELGAKVVLLRLEVVLAGRPALLLEEDGVAREVRE